jgi:pimeloyl-ACP methyl ester carboxylesterase
LQVWNASLVNRIARWGFCELPNERGFLGYFNQYVVPSWRSLNIGSEEFARVTMPALVIHGMKDRNAPYGAGRDWAAALPDARLLSIEQAAHAAWIDAPETVFGSIEQFLGGTWPTAAAKVRTQ